MHYWVVRSVGERHSSVSFLDAFNQCRRVCVPPNREGRLRYFTVVASIRTPYSHQPCHRQHHPRHRGFRSRPTWRSQNRRQLNGQVIPNRFDRRRRETDSPIQQPARRLCNSRTFRHVKDAQRHSLTFI